MTAETEEAMLLWSSFIPCKAETVSAGSENVGMLTRSDGAEILGMVAGADGEAVLCVAASWLSMLFPSSFT